MTLKELREKDGQFLYKLSGLLRSYIDWELCAGVGFIRCKSTPKLRLCAIHKERRVEFDLNRIDSAIAYDLEGSSLAPLVSDLYKYLLQDKQEEDTRRKLEARLPMYEAVANL